MVTLLPIDSAPKDGRPVWVIGWNYGDETRGEHRTWAYWYGGHWREAGAEESKLLFLVYWMPMETQR